MAWVIGIGIFILVAAIFPRVVFGSLAFAGLALLGFFLIKDAENKQHERAVNSISITVSHNIVDCNDQFPLLVVIRNSSPYRVEKIRFWIMGHRPNHSTPLYGSDYSDPGYISDRILQVGESWRSCWGLPRPNPLIAQNIFMESPPNNLIWSAHRVAPQFRER